MKKIFLTLSIFLLLVCLTTAVSATDNSTEKISTQDTSKISQINTDNDNINQNINIEKTVTKDTNTSTKTSSNQQTVYVSTTGKDTNVGTQASPKATIRNAFDTVSEGGTIYIQSGTYNEHGILLNKNVNIIGESTKTTIINSHKKHTFTVSANVFMKAFTIMNATEKNSGGAIYNKGTLKLEGIKVTTSYATLYGGAIYNKGKLSAVKSSFSSSNAKNGGAIFNTGNLNLTRCTFSSNKAKQIGSAIFSTGILNIYGCNFTCNSNTSLYINQNNNTNNIQSSSFISNTGTDGGALYNRKSRLAIHKTLFADNTAENEGAAIYNSGTLTCTASTFNSNTAKNGGAISSHNTLKLDSASVKYNTATQNGGAVYSISALTVSNTKFNKNTAIKGGAVFTKSNNVVNLIVDTSQFTNNEAKDGGALYVYNLTKLTVRNSAFTANKNNSIVLQTSAANNIITNTSFSKNSATYGGAIRNNFSPLTLTRNYISSNTAKLGGAVYNYRAKVDMSYNSILNNNNDVYNEEGSVTANYNWWGSNAGPSNNRAYQTTVNNWLYMTLTNNNQKLVNNTVTTVISLYNSYNGKTVTALTDRNKLYDIKVTVSVSGAGISKTLTPITSGYYTFNTVFTKEGTVTVVAAISSQKLTDTFTVKNPSSDSKITSMFIQIGASVTSSDVTKWKAAGITDVYVQTSVAKNNTSKLRSVINLCKNTNIRVHAWVICFGSDDGFDISTKRQNLVKNFIKSTIRINGISGICLDYVRYSGLNPSSVNPNVITNFVRDVNTIVKGYNKNLIISACVFAEKEGTKEYYGQDYVAMGKYCDVLLPMAYKYDYNAGRNWLKDVTKYIVNRVNCKVVTVLQTYKQSGTSYSKLSASELESDAKAVMSVGSYGYSLFRYGRISSYPQSAVKL